MRLFSKTWKSTPAAGIFLSCACYLLSSCKLQDSPLCLRETRLLDDGKVIGLEFVFIVTDVFYSTCIVFLVYELFKNFVCLTGPVSQFRV